MGSNVNKPLVETHSREQIMRKKSAMAGGGTKSSKKSGKSSAKDSLSNSNIINSSNQSTSKTGSYIQLSNPPGPDGDNLRSGLPSGSLRQSLSDSDPSSPTSSMDSPSESGMLKHNGTADYHAVSLSRQDHGILQTNGPLSSSAVQKPNYLYNSLPTSPVHGKPPTGTKGGSQPNTPLSHFSLRSKGSNSVNGGYNAVNQTAALPLAPASQGVYHTSTTSAKPLHPSPAFATKANGLTVNGAADTNNKIVTVADVESPKRANGIGENESRCSSAMSVATVISPAESASSQKGKMTVGEIVQQIESRSAELLKREDFTHPDVQADLQFLAQQSRYNADMLVKRKLVTKMVENGISEIFIRVHKSVNSVDYLRLLTKSKDVKGSGLQMSSEPTEDAKNGILENGAKDDDIELIDNDEGSQKDDDKKHGKSLPDCVKNFKSVISMMSNVTEKSPSLCEDILRRGLVRNLLHDLTDPRLSAHELNREPNKMYIVKGYLAILGNVVRFHGDARDHFREASAVKILQHYLKSNLIIIKMRTIMLLSYLITESENDIINAADKNISLMVKVLHSTVDADNHYSKKYGYWAVEILAGLNRLATFESNKERIVGRGASTLYTRLLQPLCSEEEQLLAAQGLWLLAFHPGNRNKFREDQTCMQSLDQLFRNSPRDEIRRTSRGALWVIQDKTNSMVRSVNNASPAAHREGSTGGVNHVMLSYQWGSKVNALRLRDKLRAAGYKVWMDVDNQGLHLEAIADAVEKAAVVLLCLSQKYKDSPSCRTEADLASRLRRDVIALRVQPKYQADGWLGVIVGGRLALDLSREDQWDLTFSNLVRELGSRGRIRPMDHIMDASGSRSTLMSSNTSIVTAIQEGHQRLLNWSVDDVGKWLSENSLDSLKPKFRQVSGELLLEIRKMQRCAPEAFYANIKSDLGLDFIQTLKFTRALDKL